MLMPAVRIRPVKNGNGDNLPGEQADGPVPAARANRCPRASTARWIGAEARTRKDAGMAASCRAYQSGSLVVAWRRVRLSSSGSRRPRLLGTQRDVSSTVASISTSTGWVQPWDRCSSRVRSASSPGGGVNVSGRTSMVTIRSTRSTRRACTVCDQPSRYHRLCRSTTAHGSTSITRSGARPIRYARRSRRAAVHASISWVVSSGLARSRARAAEPRPHGTRGPGRPPPPAEPDDLGQRAAHQIAGSAAYL